MTSWSEPLQAALKALRANKLRSALTTLGIIIGVAAVIIVVSLVQGLERSVLKQIERAGSQTLFVRPVFPGDMPFDEFSKIRNRDLTVEDMRALQRAVPQISQVTPILFSSSELKANGRATSAGVVMTEDSYVEVNGIDLQAGRNFVPSDLRLRSKVAIVGPKVLEKLAIQGNPVGQILQTPTLSLEIIGVLAEQGTTMGNDPDSNILIPLSTGLATLPDQQRRQLMFQARIDPKVNVEDGEDLLKEALRRIKGVRPKEREGFQIFSQKQIASIIGNITGVITAVAGGMVSIALLVGGIGIMNIMLVSVTERTREIGVRKAVGAKRRDVMLQFLIEAAMLSVLGGAVGILLGYGVGAALSQALVKTVAPIPLWAVVSAFAIPAAIGVIFGLYPAAKASKLDPIEALRFE
ncbi:MAG: Macrolide export ATP-binding/permease protein MacB [Acidobacteria bacterium ADurb.Bin340]|nr:MAG: Macrolide export ATP-binding/permease protein MacB [Acidobacteria bacterium ADurb.Bin340]